MKFTCLSTVLALLVAASLLGSQGVAHGIDPNLYYHDQTWEWIEKPWDGNNAQYLQIGTRIQKQVETGKELEKAYHGYLAAVFKKPLDPIAQFSRAYFLVSMDWGKKLNLTARKTGFHSELLIAWQGLVKAKSPRCREYDRIRFIINCREAPHLQLTPMGKRLFESNPKDRSSKFFYVRLLNYSEKGAVLRLALKLAKEIQVSEPDQPHGYGLVASSYSSLWLVEHDKKNAYLAIENYQKSIDLSKDKDWKSWGKHLIEVLRDEIKKAGG